MQFAIQKRHILSDNQQKAHKRFKVIYRSSGQWWSFFYPSSTWLSVFGDLVRRDAGCEILIDNEKVADMVTSSSLSSKLVETELHSAQKKSWKFIMWTKGGKWKEKKKPSSHISNEINIKQAAVTRTSNTHNKAFQPSKIWARKCLKKAPQTTLHNLSI